LHTPILHRERKAILKTLALALALSAVPALACASDLVVGVVHDTDGFPVSGASVTLRGAAGAAGSGKTAADGTFAIDATVDVDAVDVRCAYCIGMTVARTPGRSVVAVVRRFAALRDRGISPDDSRVLPYSSATDLASLMPFVVATRGSISDRGLDGARGSVVADGIAFYRATDGVDLGTAIPAHGTASIAETDPTQANAYDAYSSAGLFSIDTLDQSAGLARVDGSDADDLTIRAGNTLRGAFETAGGTDAASRAVATGTLPTAGGTLDLSAVAASGRDANAAGFSTTLVTPVRTASLTTSLSMSRSIDPNGPENDNLAALSLQSGDITYGIRAQRTSGFVEIGTGVQYDERAFVQALHDDGRTRVFASLAAAQEGESALNQASTNGGLLPILAVSTRIGPSFALHADSVDALLATPLYLLDTVPNGTGVARSHLIDAGLTFDDGNRIHIDAMVFRQTVTGSAYGVTGGSGISAIWQIAPALTLRSWTLISSTSADNTNSVYNPTLGVTNSVYATGAGSLNRSVTWLTAGSVLRVDAIWRGGYLEGDISVPAGPHARFVAGTRREGPNRVLTAGISWR
jgi:hypothetical protein